MRIFRILLAALLLVSFMSFAPLNTDARSRNSRQLSNIDLQNNLRKQQRTLNTMSRTSKSLHNRSRRIINRSRKTYNKYYKRYQKKVRQYYQRRGKRR